VSIHLFNIGKVQVQIGFVIRDWRKYCSPLQTSKEVLF